MYNFKFDYTVLLYICWELNSNRVTIQIMKLKNLQKVNWSISLLKHINVQTILL